MDIANGLQNPVLPLWVEYTKALGAPIVAFIAACAAGGIAYRQWVTARNKLKLDFFDRRVAIYTAAVDVINWMTAPDRENAECIAELRKHTAIARWLLSEDIADHLTKLNERARLADAKERPYRVIFAEGGEAAVLKAVKEHSTGRYIEVAELDKLFEPYLSVRH